MKLARFELRRFRGLLPRLALIFALLVPVFYGAIYLTANWNPTGHLDRLPVALVNQDQPVTYDGKRVQAGQDFTDKVLAGHQFQWHLTSQQDADDGLRTGRYYLEVIVPPQFSARLVSGAGNNPQRAQIILNRNDANGYVIGSVVGRAEDTIQESVNQSADQTYFQAVFGNLNTIRDGMTQARDGSAQLVDGLTKAKSGSAQLVTGTTSASSGATQLASGTSQLNQGMGQLSTGASKLSSGLGTLSSGSATLANGAQQVADGTQQLQDTIVPALGTVNQQLKGVQQTSTQLNAAVQQLNTNVNGANSSVNTNLTALTDALNQLGQQVPQVTSTLPYRNAVQALARARSNADAIAQASNAAAQQSRSINSQIQQNPLGRQLSGASAKLTQLNTGAHQVASGSQSLHGGIMDAGQGASQLQVGITKAAGAASQLSTGASTLSSGLTQLRTGATQLDSGNAQLLTGAKKLHQGLADGVQRLPLLSQDQQNKAAQVLSSPADVQATVQNPAKYYGRGLAPLFFSIALWVFGISGFLVMRPISGRLLTSRMNPVRLMLSAWLPFGTVAVSGALLMLGVVWVALPLAPVHPWAIIGLTVLTAVTFSLIAHLLRIAIGLPGSALLLVWLILQLSSTGGTYPRQVLPKFFQWINPAMPITYSVNAYRVVISGGMWSHFWLDAAVLLAFAVAAVVLDVLAVRGRQRFRLDDLHPPLG